MPIYIGFGSVAFSEPERILNLIFSGPAIPYDWLFPQVSAVVHHGGAGTRHAGLRFGKPTLIIPFTLDQFFWGNQVAKSGVGPDPIPFKKLTQENLAEAISELCHNSV